MRAVLWNRVMEMESKLEETKRQVNSRLLRGNQAVPRESAPTLAPGRAIPSPGVPWRILSQPLTRQVAFYAASRRAGVSCGGCWHSWIFSRKGRGLKREPIGRALPPGAPPAREFTYALQAILHKSSGRIGDENLKALRLRLALD